MFVMSVNFITHVEFYQDVNVVGQVTTKWQTMRCRIRRRRCDVVVLITCCSLLMILASTTYIDASILITTVPQYITTATTTTVTTPTTISTAVLKTELENATLDLFCKYKSVTW